MERRTASDLTREPRGGDDEGLAGAAVKCINDGKKNSGRKKETNLINLRDPSQSWKLSEVRGVEILL